MAFGKDDKLGSVFVGNGMFNNQMFAESFKMFSNYISVLNRTNATGNIPDTNANSVAVERGN